MSMYKCNYCSREFTQKYSLAKHQRTTRYCLLLQENKSPQEHMCGHCGRSFKHQYLLNRHQATTRYCLLKRDEEHISIEESTEDNPTLDKPHLDADEKLRMLEERIEIQRQEELAKLEKQRQEELEKLEKKQQDELEAVKALIGKSNTKKKITEDGNKNYVQTMEPVTVGAIADMAIEHLDIVDLEKGIEAIVEFTAEYPLKNKVVCMDRARRKFKYVNEAGDTVIDFGGAQLAKTVFSGIQGRCTELIDQRYVGLMSSVQESVAKNEGYLDSVWDNMRLGAQLQDLKMGVAEAATGKENELQRAFVRKLAKKL